MRYAILSDIHANLPALDAVLAALPPELPIWFLGDAVGYYAHSRGVLERLQRLRDEGRLTVWLKGNHDAALAHPDIGMLDIHDVARVALEQTRADLSPDELALLAGRDEGPVTPIPGAVSAVHGGPDAPLIHYLHDSVDAAAAAAACPTPLCLVGHTHRPLKLFSTSPAEPHSWRRQPLFQAQGNTYRYTEPMVFLNPGSVGQPRDGFVLPDGRPHAAYAILDHGAGSFTVHRVGYDPEPLFESTRRWLKQLLPADDIERLLRRLLHSV